MNLKVYLRCIPKPLIILVFFYGCSENKPELNFTEELKNVTDAGDIKNFNLDSLHIRLLDNNTYQLNYLLSISGADTASDANFVYLPLLISEKPVRFLRYPSLPDFKIEMLEVESISEHYYYLASISKEDLFKKFDTLTNKIFIDLEYVAHFITSDDYNNIKVPFAYPSGTTNLNLNADWNTKLNPPVLYSTFSKDKDELFQLPKSLEPTKQVFVTQYNFQKGEIIDIDISEKANFYKTKIWLFLLIPVGLIIILFYKNRYKIKYRSARYRERLKDINELELILTKRKKSKIQDDKKYTSTDKASSFSGPNEDILTKKENDIFQLEEKLHHLDKFKQHYKRTGRRIPVSLVYAFILFVITLILLLISTIVQGQKRSQIKDKYILEDVTIKAKPIFQSIDELDVLLNIKFQLITPETNKVNNTFTIVFPASEIETSKEDITSSPAGLLQMVRPLRAGYEIQFSSAYSNRVSEGQFEYMYTNLKANKSVSDPRLKKKRDKDFIELTIMLHKFKSLKSALNEKPFLWISPGKLHEFPYDESQIEIPISFDKVSVITNVDVAKLSNYVTKDIFMKVDTGMIGFNEEYSSFKTDRGLRHYVQANQQVLLQLDLNRSAFMRWIWPVSFIILAIMLPIVYVFFKRGILFFIITFIGLNSKFIFAFFIKEYKLDVPAFFDSPHYANKALLWLGFAIILFIISLIISVLIKKRKI